MRGVEPLKVARLSLVERNFSLPEILLDRDLAKLGDVYVNFAYSLARSLSYGKGVNARVPSRVLSESLKRSGLRNLLPRRTTIHDQADAVEALSVYAWLTGTLSFEDYVTILTRAKEDETAVFVDVLKEITRRLTAKVDKSH